MKHILRCVSCGGYTLKERCGCGGDAVNPKPPKYSPEDAYADYRRKAKRQSLVDAGLL